MEILIGIAVAIVVGLIILIGGARWVFGLLIIGGNEVGVVIKILDMGGKQLPPGKQIALNSEPGAQADTLAPGLYWGKWPWMYDIRKVAVTEIPPGQIGLVVAIDGAPIPPERILGKVVASDSFQDARAFLTNGGEKGRQLGVLTAGKYRINTALFKIITAQNAGQFGLNPEDLMVYRVADDTVGILTILDGRPIAEGEIAGLYLPGHDNFQNAQAFINAGGQRGLQEQVLLSGSWNLNPWFARVEQVPMTAIPIGYVGVVISFVGKAHEDVSGTEFKHGDLVNEGHKGVWVTPLYPGKHPINTRVMRAELVPTTNIVLNWANRTETHNYDARLASITVRSRDGFGFNLDVSQIIHVAALDAPKVISRVGSVQNLVDHVLQPTVGNYFRNAAQSYTVLDFLSARSERQEEATQHITIALKQYDVQAIDTLIGDINPPEELMHTLTERKIAEEQQKTYEVQQAAQTQRQELVRETAIADIQQEVVKAERGVNISDLQAQSQIKQANGEAESIKLRAAGEAEAIRVTGEAKADAYRMGASALGESGFTAVQLMQIIGDSGVKIIPEINVTSGGVGSGGISEALLAMLLRNQVPATNGATNGTTPATKE